MALFESQNVCGICESQEIEDVINLTDQPPANSLHKLGEKKPPNVPLRLAYCRNCSTVLLRECVDPSYLFNQYVWVTGTSPSVVNYSQDFCAWALERCSEEQPFVVEIASNDGTFLSRFQEAGCSVLGVDPAKNIAEKASCAGLPTLAEFFNEDIAARISKDQGKAQIVVARNVIPHVKHVHSVIQGIADLLTENGTGIIEFHDGGLILKELHYDSIYHEHLYYFTLKTMSNLLSSHGLHAFDVRKSKVSGGSWVVYFSKSQKKEQHALLTAKKKEADEEVNVLKSWQNFAKLSTEHAQGLHEVVCSYGGKLVAYGASARSSTLLNFSRLNSEHIQAVIDNNPLKHGLLTPGSDIPIISRADGQALIDQGMPVLLLAWNFEQEIVADLRKSGFKGDIIVPLPNAVRVL